MQTFVAQDTVTLSGSGVGTLTQGHSGWLELPQYPNAVAWLQVFEINPPSGGAVNIGYQAAPHADESLFAVLTGPLITVPFAMATGVTTTPLIKDLMTVPLARWFRWQLTTTGSGKWDVTFRLFVAAHSLKRQKR